MFKHDTRIFIQSTLGSGKKLLSMMEGTYWLSLTRGVPGVNGRSAADPVEGEDSPKEESVFQITELSWIVPVNSLKSGTATKMFLVQVRDIYPSLLLLVHMNFYLFFFCINLFVCS